MGELFLRVDEKIVQIHIYGAGIRVLDDYIPAKLVYTKIGYDLFFEDEKCAS